MKKWSSILLAAALLLAARSADAFRTASDLPRFAGSTPPIAWPGGAVHYQISTVGLSASELTFLTETARTSFSAWERLSCGGPVFVFDRFTDAPAAPRDGVNTIEIVRSGWRTDDPTSATPEAAAMTDVGYSKTGTGEWVIAEADLYVNAEAIQWWLGPGSAGNRQPASLLTHEGGHMLGLLHPCERAGKDGAPDCAQHPESWLTTMYPEYDVDQVTLQEDDVAGACFLYPHAELDAGFRGVPSIDRLCDAGTLCATGPSCLGSSCAALAPDGDPCVDSSICASKKCLSDGHCAGQCQSSEDCPPSHTCKASDASDGSGQAGGVCQPAKDAIPSGLGAACSDSTTCTGRQCVQRGQDTPFCTRPCDAVPCPEGWTCDEVQRHAVCVPRVVTPAGGCAIGRGSPLGASPRTSTSDILIATSCAVFVLSRSRRRGAPLRRFRHRSRTGLREKDR